MTAGLTVFLLILLWVFHETSFDEFNENKDRIYRVENVGANGERQAGLNSMEAPLMKQNIPEIEKIVRFANRASDHIVYTLDEQNSKDTYAGGPPIFIDNDFFDIFSFEFIAGNPKTALAQKNTVVITESLAMTIFGSTDPIGKQLYSNDPKTPEVQIITGVIKDRDNFHIPFKILYSYASLEEIWDNFNVHIDNWIAPVNDTYVMISPNVKVDVLEKKISSLISQHRPQDDKKVVQQDFKYYLRPLADIYFNGSHVASAVNGLSGDSKKVLAYTTIAFFTLLLACINFINLNSAKSFERAKEVGIKKISGASRTAVFIQFLGEVVILCIISMVLALIFAHSLLPNFNQLMNASLSFSQLLNPLTFSAMILGLIIISLAAGGFPALYMSSFEPNKVIKGLPAVSGKGVNLKKINLIVQFSITIILLIGAITIFQQVDYMKNIELGFAKEYRAVFRFDGMLFPEKSEVVKRTLLTNPNIKSVSHAYAIPGRNKVENMPLSTLTFNGSKYELTWDGIDDDYLKTLDLEMSAGRFFEKNRKNDFYSWLHGQNNENNECNIVLNESAVKAIGLSQPIGTTGKLEELGFPKIKVIGVVKDFHVNSLNNPIKPMFYMWSARSYQMIVKMSSVDMTETLGFIESEVENITKTKVDIQFLDNVFDRQYKEDDNFSKLIGYFTALAILIACMGLLGMAMHTIKLRIKEIGIRKIVGASSFQILRLLMGSFVKIVVVSTILAIPIAWMAMEGWLGNYPYRIDQHWTVFAIACGLTIFIAMSTIIWQSWQASSQNPARLIRYE
jgi:putative ABC transport system permease protein